MKRLASALLLTSVLLLAAPAVHAADTTAQLSLIQVGERNLVKGFHYYVLNIGDWIQGLVTRLAPASKVSSGDVCEDQSQCPAGLACLNTCLSGGTDCDTFVKRCITGPKQISVIGPYGSCDMKDVCAKGTSCQRVCPEGQSCNAINVCLPEPVVGPTCKTDDQCLATCLANGLPPVDGLAIQASCDAGFCGCHVVAFNPAAPRVACANGAPNFACPHGTLAACTTDGRPTCLLAPEFGGHCQADTECARVGCADGLSPFCDTDTLCRCRGTKQETVACTSDNQCGSITCGDSQKKVCASGACSCAETQQLQQNTCQADSQCNGANCPSGYSAACVTGQCACQRTVQAPITCTDVSQCGAISCPADYSKACVSNQCACTRTRTSTDSSTTLP